MIASKLIHILI